MRWVWIVLGVLAVLLGIAWTLQGLNILGGSAMSGHLQYTMSGHLQYTMSGHLQYTMSGHLQYTMLGVIVLVIGLALVGVGSRRRTRSA